MAAGGRTTLRMLRFALARWGSDRRHLERVISENDRGLAWCVRTLSAAREMQTNSQLSAAPEQRPETLKPSQPSGSGDQAEVAIHPHPEVEEASSINYSAVSNLKVSSRHNLAMIFTCKVCETRSVKTACRESYEKGIVVARCDGCNNLHLIADRLGWFGKPGSVEEFLAARGEEVKKGSADTLNLTLEDLAGLKSL
ncbi:zim17-type zinc finger protein [Wolffia australiana]